MSISQVSKGPPYPHAHAVTSQTCPQSSPNLSYLNPDGPPDCASWTLRQCAAVCRKHSPCRHVHKGKQLCLPCAGMNLWVGPGVQLLTAENCRAACAQWHAEVKMSTWVWTVDFNGERAFFFFLNKRHFITSSPSSRRFCQTVLLKEPFTPPPPAKLTGTTLIFCLHHEKDCLKATPYCCRADSLHNHARTLDGSA